MILNLDHIAILTTDLKALSETLPDWLTGYEFEKHASEGTLEQYVVPPSGDDPSILLLEAIQDGPYKRAVEKRGPGLHHVAVATDDITAAAEHFATFGLLLHPYSLRSLKNKVVWLCRPGIPFVIELFKPKSIKPLEQQQTTIDLPSALVGDHKPFEFIPNARITTSDNPNITLSIGENKFELAL